MTEGKCSQPEQHTMSRPKHPSAKPGQESLPTVLVAVSESESLREPVPVWTLCLEAEL